MNFALGILIGAGLMRTLQSMAARMRENDRRKRIKQSNQQSQQLIAQVVDYARKRGAL